MSTTAVLPLFAGFGIEIEYMIVDRETLAVSPVADRLIEAACGAIVNETPQGVLAWSNELALHVIELKTNGPSPTLRGLAGAFRADLARIDALLEPLGARVLPTAMHPFMDPARDMRLWPHGQDEIYAAYHRVFDCRGHGWTNLQSVHLNLPFDGDAEFTRLHAAIRLLLPLLPALAASSPVIEGHIANNLDQRLACYRLNQTRIPEITGRVIPEDVTGRADYEQRILQPMYKAIAPHDPEGLLQEEWLNSRGAIARFDRNAIEIRVLDVQECPRADLAIAAFIVTILKALVEERLCDLATQRAFATDTLAAPFMRAVEQGGEALVTDAGWLRAFGFPGTRACASEVIAHLLDRCPPSAEGDADADAVIATIVERGCLARRILDALGPEPWGERLVAAYRELADCAVANRLFA